jgi:hypothetical protein
MGIINPGIWLPLAEERYRVTYGTGDLTYAMGGFSITRTAQSLRRFHYRRITPTVGEASEKTFRSLDAAAHGRALFLRDWLGSAMERPLAERFVWLQSAFAADVDVDAWSDTAAETVILQRGELFLLQPSGLA